MTTPSPPADDQDLAYVDASPTTKGSAALDGIAGAVVGLSGLQFVTSAAWYGDDAWKNAVPWTLVVLGAIQLGLALMVLRNHHPAAIAAAINAALLAVGAVVWLLLSLTGGMLSCMAIAAVPTAGAAAIMAPIALPHTKRGWAAKKRLAESGIELGM